MPIFFIVPVWLLSLLVGAAMLCFPRTRFLACYLFFCPAVAIVFSILSVLMLFALSRLFDFSRVKSEWAQIFLILGPMMFGGVLGLLVGGLAARKANAKFGWK